jgi:hypothetical protein
MRNAVREGAQVRIFVSTTRAARASEVALTLRRLGHEVSKASTIPAPTGWARAPAVAFRDEFLQLDRPLFTDLFYEDLRRSDLVVLVLPGDRMSHFEIGWAVGAGKRTAILLDDPVSSPESVYLMADRLCVSLPDLCAYIGRKRKGGGTRAATRA